MTKRQNLRKKMRDQRAQISPNEHRAISATIVKHLLENLMPKSIGFCWPIANEVDILPAIFHWQQQGVLTLLAKVVQKNAPLQFLPWQRHEPLEKDQCGIWAPLGDAFEVPEMLLVPFLAMDKNGFRLGYGGGYFDRTLSLYPQIQSIGVGFEQALIPCIFKQEHDVPLSAVVTEAGFCVFPR